MDGWDNVGVAAGASAGTSLCSPAFRQGSRCQDCGPSAMAALLNGGCSCRSGVLHRGLVLWNLGVWIVTT